MLDIAFAKPALPKSGALVLLIGEGEVASGLWQQVDEATGGAIARAFKSAEFKGAKGKICSILAPGAGLSRVIAVQVSQDPAPILFAATETSDLAVLDALTGRLRHIEKRVAQSPWMLLNP